MKSICFSGHRTINKTDKLKNTLTDVLCRLIEKDGATDFYAGGAIGFDTLAAEAVIRPRQVYPHIKLHLILPCCEAEQTARWNDSQKSEYRKILAAADSVEYISEHYFDGCMKKRNARLIELSECCVCYYNDKKSASGTGQTVRMALKKGIKIINIFSLENQCYSH